MTSQELVSTGDDGEIPFDGTYEDARGTTVERPYIGETQLFDDLQYQRALPIAKKKRLPDFLRHHVPVNQRGPYKLNEFPGLLGERQGPASYAMCTAVKQMINTQGRQVKGGGEPCNGKAINFSGLCSRHGGALFPFDQKRIDWELAPRHIKFKYGKLSVEDLDDEELARGQIRKPNGEFTDNKFVSAEIHDKMVQTLFQRSDQIMRTNLIAAVEAMGEIAKGTAYEPQDRLKAADMIHKWLRGNVPQKVEIGITKPFEDILDAVFTGGSRSDSRARRGIEEEIIDAEVVDLDHEAKVMEEEILHAQELLPDEDDDEEYPYDDDRDKPLRVAEHAPKPPTHYGPAHKEFHHKPDDPEGIINHERQRKANEAEAKAREAAWLRKAQKEKTRKAMAKRKAFVNMGHEDLPVPLEMQVDEGEEFTTFKFEEPQ